MISEFRKLTTIAILSDLLKDVDKNNIAKINVTFSCEYDDNIYELRPRAIIIFKDYSIFTEDLTRYFPSEMDEYIVDYQIAPEELTSEPTNKIVSFIHSVVNNPVRGILFYNSAMDLFVAVVATVSHNMETFDSLQCIDIPNSLFTLEEIEILKDKISEYSYINLYLNI